MYWRENTTPISVHICAQFGYDIVNCDKQNYHCAADKHLNLHNYLKSYPFFLQIHVMLAINFHFSRHQIKAADLRPQLSDYLCFNNALLLPIKYTPYSIKYTIMRGFSLDNEQ
jgi:hypothetical protein